MPQTKRTEDARQLSPAEFRAAIAGVRAIAPPTKRSKSEADARRLNDAEWKAEKRKLGLR